MNKQEAITLVTLGIDAVEIEKLGVLVNDNGQYFMKLKLHDFYVTFEEYYYPTFKVYAIFTEKISEAYKCTKEEAKKIPTVSMGIVGEIMNKLTPREIRLKLGMTIREMADELNVPKSSYGYWENKNKFTEEIMQKAYKIYDKAKEHMEDDGIDIVEKIGTIKRHYKLSYDNLAQMVGASYGSTVTNWLNGMRPQLKYMIRINELYYSIVNKKLNSKAVNRNTFCRINPLDRESWKVKMENQVIVWK